MWNGSSERAITQCCPCSRNIKHSNIGWPKSPTASGCDELAVVREVLWWQAVQCLVHQYGYLKFNTLPYWEPVKLSQYWRDVLAPGSASDETCSSILNSLKALNQSVGIADNRVAVVEARRYKCMDYCRAPSCPEISDIRQILTLSWNLKLSWNLRHLVRMSWYWPSLCCSYGIVFILYLVTSYLDSCY